MRTRLRLFLDWGITFEEPYQTPEHGQRKVYYAGRQELEAAIQNRYWAGAGGGVREERAKPPLTKGTACAETYRGYETSASAESHTGNLVQL